MPSDGKFNGDVGVSLQCKLNNSSTMMSLKNPEIKRSYAGWYITEGDNRVCISDIDVESVKQSDPRVYEIQYAKSQLIIGLVFWPSVA